MKILLIVLAFFALTGIGPVLLHHDTYEARKQTEWQVFQEYAIPPDSEEISDNSIKRLKTVFIVKKYRVKATREDLENYYKNKLQSAGWKQVDVEKGIGFVRDDLKIKVYIENSEAMVRLVYIGDDNDI
ncbi:hypothetical protein SAMN02910356_00955 [Selenomonas sp. GACV-9]|uniref:hypothetical protein n=1 Tax=Selenomonas sp. GACV-9 TaxID=3158782 RepID=UPI0008F0BF5C|nr:hypothetical protein SAMN02910356_00955 [Selenomonas ruminantium]